MFSRKLNRWASALFLTWTLLPTTTVQAGPMSEAELIRQELDMLEQAERSPVDEASTEPAPAEFPGASPTRPDVFPAGPVYVTESDTVTTQPTSKLEDDASAWIGTASGSMGYSRANVTSPSVDGKALRLTAINGAQGSSVQFLRPTGARTNLSSYVMTASFRLQDNDPNQAGLPDSFALGLVRSDQGATATSLLRWIPSDTAGNGTWYIYDQNSSTGWRTLNVRTQLLRNQWYTLSVEVNVTCSQLNYRKLTLNEVSYSFNTAVSLVGTPGQSSVVSAAAVLMGTQANENFHLYIDSMSVSTKTTKSVICIY
ncbi:MAG: hypothetical protein ACKO6N_11765 [Myxococcota bacterium]